MENSNEPPKTKWKNKKYNTEHRKRPSQRPTSLLDQYLPSSISNANSAEHTHISEKEEDEIYIDMLDHDYNTTFESSIFESLQTMSSSLSESPSDSNTNDKTPSSKKNVFDEKILEPPPKFKPFYTYDDYNEDISLNSNELKFKPVDENEKAREQNRDAILNEILNDITPSSKIDDNFRKMMKNFNATTFREFIKSLVNFIPDAIDYYVYYLCYKFANLFHKIKSTKSKTSPDLNSDADTLKTLAYSLLALPLAYYLTYNWWFLFHKQDVYVDYAKLLEKIPPLNFFFECTMQPTNIVNYILLGLKDDSAKSTFDSLGKATGLKGLFFLFLLFFIYYILRYYSSYFNQTLNDVIDSKQNTLYSLSFAIVIISFFFKDAFNMERLVSMVSILGSPLFILIALLIKFLFIMVTVPFSLPILFVFLIVHSFFGIVMNKGFSEMWNTINIIDFEIENSFPNPETSDCFESSLFTKILYYLNKYLFRFLLPIMSLVVCMFGIRNIASLKSAQLQLMVMSFYCIVLTIIGFSAYKKASSSE